MTGRRPLSLVEQGRTFVVRGNAFQLLKDGGFRGVYAGTVRGWLLDTRRLPDLCAYLDSRRIPYTLSRAGDAE